MIHLRRVLTFVLAVAFVASAAPDADQPSPQRAMCALLKGCGLSYQSPTCTEALSDPPKSVTYDSAYCGWVRSLEKRGVVPDNKVTYEMYRWMGTKYRVTYMVADTVPVPFDALDHLIQNIPMTAKLINQYRGTDYSAEYPNPSDSLMFRGTNGGNLTGQATQVYAREDHRDRIYYGIGRVKILSWGMKGNVIIELKAWPDASDPRRSSYRMRCTMFPVNGLINSIMNMGVFRSVALGKIEDMLGDIQQAAQDYAAGKPPKKNVVYTPLEQRALDRFQQLYKAGIAQ